MDAKQKYLLAAKALDDKKATDIKVLKIAKISTLGDYFVLCEGGSTTQVKALADNVECLLKQQGAEPLRVEGYQSANWILLDYGDVMVHVFLHETREFYDLERLWADGELVDWESEA